ncbi:MAG: AraC family transcriptional regulator [Planctomycetota bacterium]
MRNDDIQFARNRPLPVRSLIDVSHKTKRANHITESHSHGRCELIYVDFGSVILKAASRRFELGTGDCFIIPPHIKHSFCGKAGRVFDFLNITFRGLPDKIIWSKVLHFMPEERRIMHILKTEYETRPQHFHQICTLKMNELFLFLERRSGGIIRDEPIRGDNRLQYRNIIVQKALKHLYENFSRPLIPEAVAKAVGVSESHLRWLLKKETRLSLRQHLRAFRIEYAKRLLRESVNNVDQICYRIGYQSVPHFCTIFKKHVGMTPSQYSRSLH